MKPTQFIGDCHGKTFELRKLVERADVPHVFQLGDMGLGFRDVTLPTLGDTFKWIRGNHDDPAQCRAHPNYAGEYGVWNDIFFIAGAFSIDHEWRRVMMMQQGAKPCWWPDEQLSEDQLEAAYQLYIKVKPRVVATHDAPTEIGTTLLRDGNFRLEKMDGVNSRTAQTFQRMLEAHQPEHWFFGHYHRTWNYEYKPWNHRHDEVTYTNFHCLDELAISDPLVLEPKVIVPESETNPSVLIVDEFAMGQFLDEFEGD